MERPNDPLSFIALYL
jgi:hypothetical protein